MIKNRRLIRSSARRIAKAVDRSIEDLNDRLVEQEPHLTDRMLGRIAESMRGFEKHGVKWTAKTLTDHGPGTQEREYGADFVGVLEIDIPGYSVRKGFLAQSKLIRNNHMSSGEFNRLISQCKQMLELSPSSYVFSMSPSGIRVIPAIAVVGAGFSDLVFNPDGLYSRSVSTFYEEHFECFIGDMSIYEPSKETLARLRARSLLYLAARTV